MTHACAPHRVASRPQERRRAARAVPRLGGRERGPARPAVRVHRRHGGRPGGGACRESWALTLSCLLRQAKPGAGRTPATRASPGRHSRGSDAHAWAVWWRPSHSARPRAASFDSLRFWGSVPQVTRAGRVCRSWRVSALEVLLRDTAVSRPKRCVPGRLLEAGQALDKGTSNTSAAPLTWPAPGSDSLWASGCVSPPAASWRLCVSRRRRRHR